MCLTLDPSVEWILTFPTGFLCSFWRRLPLLLIVGVFLEFLTDGKLVSLIIQVAGISVTVIAGANVLGGMIGGWFVFGSAPLVALAGGILLTSAVREPNS